MLKIVQLIVGGVITLGGVAVGVSVAVSTGNVVGATQTALPIVGTGLAVMGFTSQFTKSANQQKQP